MSDDSFREEIKQKNNGELLHIINNEHLFRPKVVKMAKAVLEERETEKKEQGSTSNQADGEYHALPLQDKKEFKPKYTLRTIATYQAISALWVLPFMLRLYPKLINSWKNTAILSFFVLLYVTGLVSAVLIFRKNKYGIILGCVFNVFQCIYIQLNAFYYFSAGIFSLTYVIPLHLKVNIGSSFTMSFFETGMQAIGINLVAFIATFLLFGAYNKFRKEKKFPENFY